MKSLKRLNYDLFGSALRDTPPDTSAHCIKGRLPKSSPVRLAANPRNSVRNQSPEAAMAQLDLDLGENALTAVEAGTSAMTTPNTPVPEGDERPQNFPACLADVNSQARVLRRSLVAFSTAVKTLSRVTGIAADHLPVEPALLRPILVDVMPAAHGFTDQRWSNIRSDLTALLRLCGWVDGRCDELILPWQILVAEVDTKWAKSAMANFGRHCATACGTPNEANSITLQSYETFLTAKTLNLDPRRTVNSVKRAWNKLSARRPDLGMATLVLESRLGQKSRPASEFPAAFQNELAAYLNNLRNHNPLNETGERQQAPISIEHRRRYVLRSATYLVDAGMEMSDITGLAALTTERAMRTVLMAVYQEAGGKWTEVALAIASTLVALAKHWVRVPDDQLHELMALRRRIKPPSASLSRKNRDRLAQFEDQDLLTALFELPERAFKEAERIHLIGETHKAATIFMAGICVGILLTIPLRRRTLSAIDINKNITRDKRGRIQRLVFEAKETKGKSNIDAQLTPEFGRRIEQYLTIFRPYRMDGSPNSWLCPGEGGRHLSDNSVAGHVTRLVERQLGARFNVHLARHLAATLLLNDNVANLPLVQRFLGHGQPSTTSNKYGVQQTAIAQRAYEKIVGELTAKAAKRENKRKRGRK